MDGKKKYSKQNQDAKSPAHRDELFLRLTVSGMH